MARFVPIWLIGAIFAGSTPVFAATYLTYVDGLLEYERGNYSAAFLTFQRVAEDGDARAQIALADMYHLGEGVEQDHAAAATWYQRAANQGVAVAQHSLADLHLRGFGVPKDDVRAYMWYSLSRIFADDESHAALATALRDRVAQRLSPAALADARRLMCDWWGKHQEAPPDAALGACAAD